MAEKYPIYKFDFDRWSSLAKDDPQEFERLRTSVVEDAISEGHNHRRLRGIQFRIEIERTRSKTPLQSCLRIYNLMINEFYNLKEHCSSAYISLSKVDKDSRKRPLSENVILFPSKNE